MRHISLNRTLPVLRRWLLTAPTLWRSAPLSHGYAPNPVMPVTGPKNDKNVTTQS